MVESKWKISAQLSRVCPLSDGKILCTFPFSLCLFKEKIEKWSHCSAYSFFQFLKSYAFSVSGESDVITGLPD